MEADDAEYDVPVPMAVDGAAAAHDAAGEETSSEISSDSDTSDSAVLQMRELRRAAAAAAGAEAKEQAAEEDEGPLFMQLRGFSTQVKALLLSSAQHESVSGPVRIGKDAETAAAAATELFLRNLVEKAGAHATKQNSRTIHYRHIADMKDQMQEFAFLDPMFKDSVASTERRQHRKLQESQQQKIAAASTTPAPESPAPEPPGSPAAREAAGDTGAAAAPIETWTRESVEAAAPPPADEADAAAPAEPPAAPAAEGAGDTMDE